jgi:hypothetical protein
VVELILLFYQKEKDRKGKNERREGDLGLGKHKTV